jgi:hypothetical protein
MGWHALHLNKRVVARYVLYSISLCSFYFMWLVGDAQGQKTPQGRRYGNPVHVSALRLCIHDVEIKHTKYQTAIQVGAADYIALAQHYHTVFITDIPIMSMRMIDKVWDGCCTLFWKLFIIFFGVFFLWILRGLMDAWTHLFQVLCKLYFFVLV